MSILSRSVPVLMLFASLTSAQIPGSPGFSTVMDASNTPLPMNPFRTQEPYAKGSISVRELQHPLEGKALRLLEKAMLSFAKGDAQHGMDQARAAEAYPAAEPFALALEANEYLRAGDFASAIPKYERATMILPEKPEFHSNFAYALASTGRFEEAHREAKMALKLDPGRTKARLVMGQILLQLGRKEEAEFHLKKAAMDLSVARELLSRYYGK